MKKRYVMWLAGAAVAGLVCAVLFHTLSGGGPAEKLPGVVRQEGNCYLIENHSTSYLVWHAAKVRGATLVHVDTHDDCRYIPPDKIRDLQALTAGRKYDEIFRLSDINLVQSFEVREEKFLYDLGNFIYPCLLDGTISTFYWVVPEKAIGEESRALLLPHLKGVLKLADLPDFENRGADGFAFDCYGARLIVTTLDGLPQLPPGCLLDLDTDFFAFPHAMTDDHLEKDLIWDPGTVCMTLNKLAPEPKVVTVCTSVPGEYLPLILRFIPEACFRFFADGRYPEEAADFMRTVAAMRLNKSDIPPIPPFKPGYFAATHEYLTGCLLLLDQKEVEAIRRMEHAAHIEPAYAGGLLDAARAAIAMRKFGMAHDLINRFERIAGHKTMKSVRFRANAFLDAGETAKAKELLSGLLAWNEAFPDLLLSAAVAEKEGQYDEALHLYSKARNERPRNPEPYYNAGLIMAKKGMTNEAVQNYETALRLKPDLVPAHLNLGTILAERNEYDRALEHLQAALRLDPDNPLAHNTAGLVLVLKGEPAEAEAHYRKALEVFPGFAEAHNNMGRLLAGKGDADAAIGHFTRAVEQKPGYADAHRNLATELARKKQFAEAIAHFSEALKLEPSDPYAHNNLANALLETGEAEEAIKHYREALRLKPDFAEAQAGLQMALDRSEE